MKRTPMRACGLAGSLRKASYNRALLRAALSVAPPGLDIEIFDRLDEIPSYNADVEAVGDPEPVTALERPHLLLRLRRDRPFFLAGTLPPARRACDRPIAMACFRLFTFFPERPDFSVPRFRSCIAFFTFD